MKAHWNHHVRKKSWDRKKPFGRWQQTKHVASWFLLQHKSLRGWYHWKYAPRRGHLSTSDSICWEQPQSLSSQSTPSVRAQLLWEFGNLCSLPTHQGICSKLKLQLLCGIKRTCRCLQLCQFYQIILQGNLDNLFHPKHAIKRIPSDNQKWQWTGESSVCR